LVNVDPTGLTNCGGDEQKQQCDNALSKTFDSRPSKWTRPAEAYKAWEIKSPAYWARQGFPEIDPDAGPAYYWDDATPEEAAAIRQQQLQNALFRNPYSATTPDGLYQQMMANRFSNLDESQRVWLHNYQSARNMGESFSGMPNRSINVIGPSTQTTLQYMGTIDAAGREVIVTAITWPVFGALGKGVGRLCKPQPTVTLCRGVNEGAGAGFELAEQGIVQPNRRWWQFWKPSASPLEHNVGAGGTLNSPYTSWTTDFSVAENFALLPETSSRGVIVVVEVPASRVIQSPNLMQVYLHQSGRIASESEVLIRGTIKGDVIRVLRVCNK
jgi:hypothetical protein